MSCNSKGANHQIPIGGINLMVKSIIIVILFFAMFYFLLLWQVVNVPPELQEIRDYYSAQYERLERIGK